MKKLIYLLIPIVLFSCKKKENLASKNDKPNSLITNVETTNSVKCHFETYIEYQDSVPLFEKPNSKIIQYFRFEDDPEYDFGGSFLFKNSELGWLQIGKDKLYPELENYWVQSDYIKIGTTNYENQKISLYEMPDKKSKIIGYLYEESSLNVLSCESDWVYVMKGDNKGWLASEFICNNPETNCN